MLKRWLLVSSLSVDGVNSCIIAKWEKVKSNSWQYICVAHISASSALLSHHLSCRVADYVCFFFLFLCLTLLAPVNEDLAAISIPLSSSSPLILTLLHLSLSVSMSVCS